MTSLILLLQGFKVPWVYTWTGALCVWCSGLRTVFFCCGTLMTSVWCRRTSLSLPFINLTFLPLRISCTVHYSIVKLSPPVKFNEPQLPLEIFVSLFASLFLFNSPYLNILKSASLSNISVEFIKFKSEVIQKYIVRLSCQQSVKRKRKNRFRFN